MPILAPLTFRKSIVELATKPIIKAEPKISDPAQRAGFFKDQ